MTDDDFAAKLRLVLKTLTISNGRLAADLAVDKSLVGRWVSGRVRPSTHNLARLTRHLAIRIDGFALLDWELSTDAFRARLGSGPTPRSTAPRDIGDFPNARAQSLIEVQREGDAYPGLYAHFRKAFRNTGEILVELMIIWRDGDRLMFRSFDPSFSHIGEILIVRHQMFFIGEDDARADGLMFMIANGVGGRKAYRLDGVALSVAGDRHRTPGACVSVMQRITDLEADATVPERDLLVSICTHMKVAYDDGTVATIAGPGIVRAVTAIVGSRADGGPMDHVLRAPLDRSLAASEVDLNPALVADLTRVRDAFVRTTTLPRLSLAYDFRSPQLREAVRD